MIVEVGTEDGGRSESDARRRHCDAARYRAYIYRGAGGRYPRPARACGGRRGGADTWVSAQDTGRSNLDYMLD